nr:hypothetical protein [Shewanella yunxiaonensis]
MKPTVADSPEAIDAVTVPAPATSEVANVTVATPLVSVSAVPIAGTNTPRELLLNLKVTNCPATTPVALLVTVALNVAGVAAEILAFEIAKAMVVVSPPPAPSPAIVKPTEADAPEATDAVTIPAPAISAVAKVTVATPLASVSAVPVAGVKLPSVLSLSLKVTNCPATTPVALLVTVALNVAGVAAEILAFEIAKAMVVVSPPPAPSPAIVKPTVAVAPEAIDAVTVPAPATSAEAKVTVATPLASVSAVPIAGTNVPSALSFSVNVTNSPAIAPVSEFLTVAVNVAGVSAAILLFEMLNVTEVVPVGGVVLPPVESESALPPPPQPLTIKPKINAQKNLTADFIVSLLVIYLNLNIFICVTA